MVPYATATFLERSMQNGFGGLSWYRDEASLSVAGRGVIFECLRSYTVQNEQGYTEVTVRGASGPISSSTLVSCHLLMFPEESPVHVTVLPYSPLNLFAGSPSTHSSHPPTR